MKPTVPRNERQAKRRTTNFFDRLTFSPIKHENKKVKLMRKKLQAKEAPRSNIPTNRQTIKFGFFNINGLDLEGGWAVKQLIKNRGIDVSIIHSTTIIQNILTRYLQ